MFGKIALAGGVALFALTGWTVAFGGEPVDTAVGNIYHYVSSNADGSRARQVYVYRAAADRLETYTMTRRCAEAGYATAWVDSGSGRAVVTTRGRLMPGARFENFAETNYDGGPRMLRASATIGRRNVEGFATIAEPAWHLYNLDLATLSVQTRGLADRRANFAFGLPAIAGNAREGEDLVRDLGRAEARFVREEDYRGTPALRFEVGGTALGRHGGPLWLDAETGDVLGAQWGLPNRPGMDDFALRLVGVDNGGETAWHALLAAHFEGCTTA